MRLLTLAWLTLLTIATPSLLTGQEPSSPHPHVTDRVSLSGLFYLTYEVDEVDGEKSSRFFVPRAYLTMRVGILPKLSGRITFDTSQDLEGDGRGDMEVRLKYAYAEYEVGNWGLVRGLGLEAGIVHMVWLDFEEHINLYRMRSPMFLERTGIFNSADFGLTLGGGFGPDLPEDYTRSVSSHYASRYGSFAVGLYNGTGYHGDERNTDKVIQGRLTLRPLPDALPGLQVSGLAITGKGNQSAESGEIPDWRTLDLFLSYQHPRGTLTAQHMWGEGNQKGTWTEPGAPGSAGDYSGYSIFGEGRLGPAWRIIAGADQVNRETGSADLGFTRLHGGVGYDLGRQNILLLSLGRRDWNEEGGPDETQLTVVFQLKF